MDELRVISDRSLQTVRGSFPNRQIPPAWERDLAALARDDVAQELIYHAKVKHYHWMRWAELQQPEGEEPEISADQRRAMQQIIMRQPVRIHMAGRWVDITFRGRAALIALGEHDLRRREIDRDLTALAQVAVQVEQKRSAGRISRTHARRRLRWLRQLHEKYYHEFLHHTRAIIANAITPDGSAATADAAPEWWSRVTPSEEGDLLVALFEVGPRRLERLGSPPKSPNPKRRMWSEDFGLWSLWSYFEKESGLRPAAFDNVDVAQGHAWLRAGALHFPPPESRKPRGKAN